MFEHNIARVALIGVAALAAAALVGRDGALGQSSSKPVASDEEPAAQLIRRNLDEAHAQLKKDNITQALKALRSAQVWEMFNDAAGKHSESSAEIAAIEARLLFKDGPALIQMLKCPQISHEYRKELVERLATIVKMEGKEQLFFTAAAKLSPETQKKIEAADQAIARLQAESQNKGTAEIQQADAKKVVDAYYEKLRVLDVKDYVGEYLTLQEGKVFEAQHGVGSMEASSLTYEYSQYMDKIVFSGAGLLEVLHSGRLSEAQKQPMLEHLRLYVRNAPTTEPAASSRRG